ncbi:MAG: hypothetical protein KF763_10440 [Cyclobacteriaceae bacterium]|nr:hypothetical protein [Cyclobacteriaceae bacterium]
MRKIALLLFIPIAVFALTTRLTGCCASYDCDSGIVFQLRLIDKDSGKDLVYDENIPLDSFKITSVTTGSEATITSLESARTLAIFFSQTSTKYELEFDSRIIPFNLEIVTLDDGDCCPDYKITDLTSPAPVQYIEAEQVFEIKI